MAEAEELPPRSNIMRYAYEFLKGLVVDAHEFLKGLVVVLRVPPLFVIDEILKNVGTAPSIEISLDLMEDTDDRAILDYYVIFVTLLKFVCGSLGKCTFVRFFLVFVHILVTDLLL